MSVSGRLNTQVRPGNRHGQELAAGTGSSSRAGWLVGGRARHPHAGTGDVGSRCPPRKHWVVPRVGAAGRGGCHAVGIGPPAIGSESEEVGDARPWKGAWDSLPSCPRMTGRVRATESLKGGEQMVRALTDGSLCIVVSQGCHSPRGGRGGTAVSLPAHSSLAAAQHSHGLNPALRAGSPGPSRGSPCPGSPQPGSILGRFLPASGVDFPAEKSRPPENVRGPGRAARPRALNLLLMDFHPQPLLLS